MGKQQKQWQTIFWALKSLQVETAAMKLKDTCSLEENILATWCEELTHLKRLMLGMIGGGGEGDDRGWDGWMASPTQWTWVWVNSRSWWWTRRPGVLQSMGSQRVRHDWATELNWTTDSIKNRSTYCGIYFHLFAEVIYNLSSVIDSIIMISASPLSLLL